MEYSFADLIRCFLVDIYRHVKPAPVVITLFTFPIFWPNFVLNLKIILWEKHSPSTEKSETVTATAPIESTTTAVSV